MQLLVFVLRPNFFSRPFLNVVPSFVRVLPITNLCVLFLVVNQLYTRDASRNWKLAGTDGSSQLTIKEPSANVVLLDYISTEKWKDVVDFDDHLDDISK